jgi:hypothetical protein
MIGNRAFSKKTVQKKRENFVKTISHVAIAALAKFT